jgi:hypothetical protein
MIPPRQEGVKAVSRKGLEFLDMEEILYREVIDIGAKIIILELLDKLRKNADKEKITARAVNFFG